MPKKTEEVIVPHPDYVIANALMMFPDGDPVLDVLSEAAGRRIEDTYIKTPEEEKEWAETLAERAKAREQVEGFVEDYVLKIFSVLALEQVTEATHDNLRLVLHQYLYDTMVCVGDQCGLESTMFGTCDGATALARKIRERESKKA